MEKSIERDRKVPRTNRHFEIYLEYVRMHNVLKLKWTIQRGYSEEIKHIWHDMAKKLNACGGPVRDITHWKKVFTEWKSHTRRKLKCNKPLNDVEKQLVELTGITSNPERKRKSAKVLKNKAAIDGNSQETKTVIKEEVDDSMGESDTSFNEQELTSNSEESRSKSSEEEKQSEKSNNVSTEKTPTPVSTQCKKQLKPIQLHANVTDSRSSKHTSSDASTQVDREMLNVPSTSGHITSMSTALLTLSQAVNRYCDILERRIF